MRISSDGITLIKRYEGLRVGAYLCPAGRWTIGYGHTRGVQPGDKITRQQAESMFEEDLEAFSSEVVALLKGSPVKQGEFDALVSFAYNCGVQALATSSLLRKVRAGDKAGAAKEFGKWHHVSSSGKLIDEPGLVARRQAEAELFLRE